MLWFSKINSEYFKNWIISTGSGHRIPEGKKLDSFVSSTRKLNNVHQWMHDLKHKRPLGGDESQRKSDLKSIGLFDRDKDDLTILGIKTINDWERYLIPIGNSDFEIHRCLLLLKNAVELKDEQYKSYIEYWRELRQSYSFNHLISTPEHLYFFSFFNKESQGYNPYDAIRGLKMTDSDFPQPIDWTAIKAYYNDPLLNPAADKYKRTIDGIVDRQGRTNFVTALELIINQRLAEAVISSLSIDNTKKDILRDIVKELSNIKAMALNQILYGPPGTGKTHNAINHALSVIDGKSINDIIGEQKADNSKRVAAKKRFDELVSLGQIQFVTFHQSYSYEDFIEGIRSVVNSSGGVEYRIEDGIFKKLCIEAGKRASPSLTFESAYELFIEEVDNSGGTFTLNTPVQSKPFNVKFTATGSSVAIPQTKDATEMAITKANLKAYVENGTIKDWKPYVTAIGEYIKEKYISKSSTIDNSGKNFVLIIDEINRGNISKIFGELITLIEKPKRLGEVEELRAKLTYSGSEDQKGFGVPSNLFIIGTMNSADKSISLVDTALRRRFEFIEYIPDPNLLSNDVEGINLQELLRTINSRIEVLLNKDHKIGHAYFINVQSKNELCEVFRNRILPLLEEYFFGDYQKIQLVLGDNAEFNKIKDNRVILDGASSDQKSLFGKEIEGFEEKSIYQINDKLILKKYDDVPVEFFKSIYTKKV